MFFGTFLSGGFLGGRTLLGPNLMLKYQEILTPRSPPLPSIGHLAVSPNTSSF